MMCSQMMIEWGLFPDLRPHVGVIGNRPCSRASVLYDATKLVILDRNVLKSIQDSRFAICIVII